MHKTIIILVRECRFIIAWHHHDHLHQRNLYAAMYMSHAYVPWKRERSSPSSFGSFVIVSSCCCRSSKSTKKIISTMLCCLLIMIISMQREEIYVRIPNQKKKLKMKKWWCLKQWQRKAAPWIMLGAISPLSLFHSFLLLIFVFSHIFSRNNKQKEREKDLLYNFEFSIWLENIFSSPQGDQGPNGH